MGYMEVQENHESMGVEYRGIYRSMRGYIGVWTIHGNMWEYHGVQGIIRGYMGVEGDTRDYRGIHGSEGGCTGIQGGYVNVQGYMGVQGDT